MNKIIIKCSINCPFKICIYDCQKNEIYNNYTDAFGFLKLPLNNGSYIITVTSIYNINPSCYIKKEYITSNKKYYFYFNILEKKKIIKIRDATYPFLPIERGTIRLWLKTMK